MPFKTFSLISLGCFRNTYDSERVIQRFREQGYLFQDDPHHADVVVINTCGFIDKAKEESITVINEAIALKKKQGVQRLIVFGCLVARYKQELKERLPEVDEWWGVDELESVSFKESSLLPSFLAFLKICEGCLHRCSYCAIPLIKGPLRSKSRDEIIKEVIHLDRRGVQEVSIIGQDITSWGKDLQEKSSLAQLVQEILKATTHIRWFRLIYTHPRYVTTELIDLIAREPRICKYIDLPIQHINDRILALMERGTTRKDITALLDTIRKRIPHAAVRTSVIVGFPGETEAEFNELLAFLKDAAFQRLGVFTYSREEGTSAFALEGQVHHATKQRRFRMVMAQQQKQARIFSQSLVGRAMDVLVTQANPDGCVARSEYDAHEVDGVVFLKKKGLKVGAFYRAEIVDAYEYDLIAQ